MFLGSNPLPTLFLVFSGKRLHNYGKSRFFNRWFSIVMLQITRPGKVSIVQSAKSPSLGDQMATPRWQRQRQELPLGCWEMQQNPWGGESLQGTSGASGAEGVPEGVRRIWSQISLWNIVLYPKQNRTEFLSRHWVRIGFYRTFISLGDLLFSAKAIGLFLRLFILEVETGAFFFCVGDGIFFGSATAGCGSIFRTPNWKFIALTQSKSKWWCVQS